MANSELVKYISQTKTEKIPDETIKAQLIKSGWSEHDISEAFTPDVKPSSLPLPPVPHFGMWVAFQYIILFICLYVSFTSLGGILHYGVDRILPDYLEKTSYNFLLRGENFLLKGYIAGIIVTFPIFAILFLILKKQALEKPIVKNLKVRKVLIYLTLVGTFLIMISNLISTIYGFLGGNATLRSFTHLVVTFFVAGVVFGYLLWEVKEDRKST